MKRIEVSGPCEPPCSPCKGCARIRDIPSAVEVVEQMRGPLLLLGGGDATRWPEFDRLLSLLAEHEERPEVWVEAPARVFDDACLDRLAARGVDGVLFHLHPSPQSNASTLAPVELANTVITAARARGLGVRYRLVTQPRDFASIALTELGEALAEFHGYLEIITPEAGPVAVERAAVEAFMLRSATLVWSGQRDYARSHLPPCTMPTLWCTRAFVFRDVLPGGPKPNETLAICADCSLRRDCVWTEREALDPAELAALRPIRSPPPWTKEPTRYEPIPRAVVAKRNHAPVVCTAPWTGMEIVDPNGHVRQCCVEWTIGIRGNVLSDSLLEVWNGHDYQAARRAMVRDATDELCHGICPRLHDRKFAEQRFRFQRGSEPFERNQLLLAEDIALGREVVRGRPLSLALCPSTYCNYDCIMCICGREPRRELTETIWEQVEELLPTLAHLSLLGGEPLASPAVMRFLYGFDRARYPDARVDLITNGALLTEKVLARMDRVAFGGVTISLNAGTPEVYEQVQRGLSLDTVLANIDALMRYRDGLPYMMGICLSFVVMPANAHTLIAFGELAHARGLSIRLLPLITDRVPQLDYYPETEAVASVLDHLAAFERWAAAVEPSWVPEIRANAESIRSEARARNGLRLPIV